MLGIDPVLDHAPVPEQAGLAMDVYEETPGWADRVYPTFGGLIDASDALKDEIGERAAAGTLAEAMLTVAMRPYPSRVLIVARRPD